MLVENFQLTKIFQNVLVTRYYFFIIDLPFICLHIHFDSKNIKLYIINRIWNSRLTTYTYYALLPNTILLMYTVFLLNCIFRVFNTICALLMLKILFQLYPSYQNCLYISYSISPYLSNYHIFSDRQENLYNKWSCLAQFCFHRLLILCSILEIWLLICSTVQYSYIS